LDVEAKLLAVVFQFSPNNRFDAGLCGSFNEFDRAMETIFVSESDGGEVVALSEVHDSVDGKGGVEEGVITVDVERNAGGARGAKGTPPEFFTLTRLDWA
jgi:hypothetical protein